MEEQIDKNKILIEGLQDAVSTLFITMIGTEAVCKESRESATFSLSADVAGIMFLLTDPPGMVACGAPAGLASNIIGKMTGINESELGSGEISDGFAEMVNIICGHIKTQYPDMRVNLTPPLSLIAKESELCWKLAHPSVILTFDIMGSELTLAASL